MGLSGRLATMGLTDLLQWAAAGAQTGRLDVRRGAVIKEIYLQDGVIVGAASNQPTELLGQHLVARGRLTEEQLRAALLTRGGADEFIGQVLIRLGFIDADQLLHALRERTEEIVYSLFEWGDAEFRFEPNARPGPKVALISLPVESVLLRGIHRHDELRRIRTIFPDGRVVLARSARTPPQEILDHPLARRILEALDGRRTIDELAFTIHASPFAVIRFLFEAHRLNLVEVLALEGPPTPVVAGEAPEAELAGLSGAARIAAAQERLSSGDAEAALGLLDDDGLAVHPDAGPVVRAAEQALLTQVYSEEFAPDAIPTATRPLEQMTEESLRPEEIFLLSRLDGHWTVKDIVDVAPLREVETIRVLRGLLRRGLIRLPQRVP